MQTKYQSKLNNRLRRIEGQIKGLQKMLDGNKYCVDIITQSRAVQKSLESFDQELLKNHLEEHVSHQFQHGQTDKATAELLKIYSLYNK